MNKVGATLDFCTAQRKIIQLSWKQ